MENNDQKHSGSLLAVALSFDTEKNNAPEVIAKGKGILAEKIIEIARENGSEIVKNSDLANLLKEVPAGKEIPEKLYKAIAAVYSYFYKINNEH